TEPQDLISVSMALFNFCSCFSESSDSSGFVCNGDVCVLPTDINFKKKKKLKKRSFSIPFSQISLRKFPKITRKIDYHSTHYLFISEFRFTLLSRKGKPPKTWG
ncbi:hypothetical protein HAX54_010074, partial [Datura stramonium]|nr:hypothetical protein [Datura stramonium]